MATLSADKTLWFLVSSLLPVYNKPKKKDNMKNN